MKSFFNLVVLACLLSLFVLPNLAQAQRFRSQNACFWEAVYDYENKRWEWTLACPAAPGSNQRIPSKPPQSQLPKVPPPDAELPRPPSPQPMPPQQTQPPRQQSPPQGQFSPPLGTPIDPTSTSRGMSNPARGGSINTSREFQLTPGDVILAVNGETITGRTHFTSAVNRSPQTMHFTVKDGRTGRVMNLVTQLSSTGYKLGVTHRDNPGGGARVVQVDRNSPATRCFLVE